VTPDTTISAYLVLLCLFTAAGAWRTGRLDPFSAQTLFNVPAAIYALGNVINYYWLGLDWPGLYGNITVSAYAEALELCIPALIAFNVAFLLPRRVAAARGNPVAAPTVEERALVRHALIGVPLGYVLLSMGLASLGWDRIFLMPYGTSTLSAAPTAFLFHVGVMVVEVCLIALCAFLFRFRRWRSPLGIWVGLLLTSYGWFSLMFGKRALILLTFLGVLMVRHLLWKRLSFAQAALWGSALLCVFVLVELGRTAPTRTPTDIVGTTTEKTGRGYGEDWRPWIGSVLSQGQLLGSLAVITEIYPDARPYRLGETYFEALVRILPRALWEDWFPLGYSELIGENWAFFFLAEAYMNFGIVGLVVVPAVMGFTLRRFDDWKERRGDTLFAPIMFAILAGDVAYLPRLDLGSISKDLVYRPLVLLFLFLAARASVRRVRAARWTPPPSWRHAAADDEPGIKDGRAR
jgi:hypothetical protein